MSKNWMRHFEIQVLDKAGEGIRLSDFKVIFNIEWNDNKWPSVATVKIYNLSPETQNRIMGKEFSRIKIIAGYDGMAPDVKASDVGKVRLVEPSQEGQNDGLNHGLIYHGDIRFTVTGKDNLTDSWIRIQACDSLEAFTMAMISTTLEKGYTLKDVYELLMRSLEPYGISRGAVPVFPATVYPRGKVFHGMVRDYLDNVAEQCGAKWQFAYGKLDMLTKDTALRAAIVLNANTGLIGMPQQTIGGGVNVRCLINPNIRLNGLINLDQTSIYRAALSEQDVSRSLGRISEQENNGYRQLDGIPRKEQPASIATDGVYIVRYIAYNGDTRGQAWYMDLICEAAGSADVYSQAAREKGL
ncbi:MULTISPECIES: hypothetical protein [Pectobacterium]|uniref:hypothetical protein n=1 Tax=Pectobacterium TaxID=122277 RepID=UPI0004E782B1|nr:hypothetical protein [Pectobacterium brasiliense]KFF70078.1 hypothetical protein IW00_04730 [Pectobacterium brasiliense]